MGDPRRHFVAVAVAVAAIVFAVLIGSPAHAAGALPVAVDWAGVGLLALMVLLLLLPWD